MKEEGVRVLVLVGAEEGLGVEGRFVGVRGVGEGWRVRRVRRREVGVRVMWGERVGGSGGVKICFRF